MSAKLSDTLPACMRTESGCNRKACPEYQVQRWTMLLLVMFTSELSELQTYHLLYLTRGDKMKRSNNGLIVILFKMVASGIANACNAAKVSYSS